MLEQEQKLIARAKAGDIECFGKLYDHYIPKIYRFVLLKTNHKTDAEDLTHEVFLSAWTNIGRYEEKGFPFSSWLYKLARNKVIDHYRLKKKQTSLDGVDDDHEAFRIDEKMGDVLDVRLHIENVMKLLSALTPDQKDVILMRFVEELTYPEIAVALEKTEGAVRLIQHRAIQELRKQFVQEA